MAFKKIKNNIFADVAEIDELYTWKWNEKVEHTDEYFEAFNKHFDKLRNELECVSIWDAVERQYSAVRLSDDCDDLAFANLDDYVLPRFAFTLVYNYYGKNGKQTETTRVVSGKLGSVWLACEALLLRSVMNGGSETMFIEGFRLVDTGDNDDYVLEIIRGS